MPWKFFEFLEQIMIGNWHFFHITQLEKLLWNLIFEFIFETRSRSRFSWPYHFCCSFVEFAFHYINRNQLNLKKRKKIEIEREQILNLLKNRKKQQGLFKSLHHVH